MADRAVRATRLKTSHQPTVQQNKPNLGCFSRTSTFTSRLAGTITEYRQTTKYPPRRLHTQPFCRGFGWATVRTSMDSNLFSLYQKTQAFRCLQTLSSPPDGQSPSATPPAASMFRSCSNSQWRSESNQGRHRSDSDASHSAPSTRQGGARNVNKQRKANEH